MRPPQHRVTGFVVVADVPHPHPVAGVPDGGVDGTVKAQHAHQPGQGRPRVMHGVELGQQPADGVEQPVKVEGGGGVRTDFNVAGGHCEEADDQPGAATSRWATARSITTPMSTATSASQP